MSEQIEQATAAPGEKRALPQCNHCIGPYGAFDLPPGESLLYHPDGTHRFTEGFQCLRALGHAGDHDFHGLW